MDDSDSIKFYILKAKGNKKERVW
ncbi:hypothetical protein OIU79_018776, partial [Salix purpurea]